MTALRKSDLPEELRNEIARLNRAGFPILPLGGGEDGKAPLLRAWAAADLPLARVLAPLYRSGSRVFGIRLDGLAVIDCDHDDPELVTAMEARFGPSPVHVRTPRGRHLYFKWAGGPLPNLKAEGLPVDIKAGPRAYVVGPLSQRVDGGFYAPARGVLGVDALPVLRAPTRPQTCARPEPTEQAAPILTGHRHVALVREAMQMIDHVDSADELAANLRAIRDDWCADPATLPDSEVQGISKWAWTCRLEGRIYCGRHSAFPVRRSALDALRGRSNQDDALALYVRLADVHGHTPGKAFPLNHPAMKAAGYTSLSKARFLAARRTLQRCRLLKQVGRHRAGSKCQTFALSLPVMTEAPNVTDLSALPRQSSQGKKEEGAKITYVAGIPTNKSGPFNDG